MKILAAKSHCSIQMLTPQIDLPAIDAATIEKQRTSKAYPANVNLLCFNTQKASINIEGNNNANTPSVFNNLATDRPIDIVLPNQSNYALPISVRYARLNEKIKEGNIKAQITLRINYL